MTSEAPVSEAVLQQIKSRVGAQHNAIVAVYA